MENNSTPLTLVGKRVTGSPLKQLEVGKLSGGFGGGEVFGERVKGRKRIWDRVK